MRIAVLALALALVGCKPDGRGLGLDVDRAMAHVTAITAMGPRPHDSDGAHNAAIYIEQELTKLGATVEKLPVGTVQLPGITVLGKTWRTPHTETTADPNLVVRFGPPGRALLVTAHYDSVPGSPGAADNAASVAILLELARVFSEEKPAQPVMLAFTAAEEAGLVGAEALAAQKSREVFFVVALDLIGGDGRLTLNGASALIGSSELQWIADAADRAGVIVSAPLPHRVISRWWPQAERADHGAFTRRDLRAVHFYNRGNDGEWIDRAYHSPRDLPARLHPESLVETASVLRAMVSLPMHDTDADGFWVPFATNTVVPRWMVFALCFILIAGTIAGLFAGKDGIIATRRRDERERGFGLLAGIGCFILGVCAAIGAELALRGSHRAAWLHDPLRALGSSAGILLGTWGLVSLVLGQLVPFKGELRYRLVAACVPLALGGLLLGIDAPELAWIWFVPAAMVALAPPPLAAVSTLLPAVFVLNPLQLREAAWNNFLPIELPLGVWVAFFAIPVAASVAWVARRYRREGPLMRRVLIGVCVLLIGGGIALAVTTEPTCSAEEFAQRHLACEPL